MADKIQSHRDLQVYQKAFDAATTLFEFSKRFPKEETYSLTDQLRRSSRSVCANLAEASLQGRVHLQIIGRGKRSGRNPSLDRIRRQIWLYEKRSSGSAASNL